MLQYLHAVVALAIFARGIDGQQTTEPPSSTPTATPSGPVTHTVSVGWAGFKFTPNTTYAQKDDIVEFRFYPRDHSVARADFKHACVPYEYTGEKRVGFWSGVHFLNGIPADPPKFSLKINDTQPVFFYCGAKGSCKDHHMVGVINPNDTWTLDKHVEYVEAAEFALTPGEDWPSESPRPTDDPDPYGGKPSETTKPDASKSSSESGSGGSGGSHLNAGQIAGIVIGSVAVLVIGAALVYLCGRRGGFDKAYRRSTPGYPPSGPPMADHKYNSTPKSPGMESWGGAAAGAGYHHEQRGSPPMGYHSRSPPLSPNNPAYGGPYAGTMVSSVGSQSDSNAAYYDQRSNPHITPPPPIAAGQSHTPRAGTPEQAPIELPTSEDPGNSPLPNYQPSRQFSWAKGAEANYRPSNKN